ncbi:MAG TPA: hypothetical protein VJZ77_22315, partial [Blastocatellia bacterium]|nr:hypothetical protein [Blastocatellia bacterium]
MAATAIRSRSHLKRIRSQTVNIDARLMIQRPRFCRLGRPQASFHIPSGRLRPSLFLRLTIRSILPETYLIAAGISDRRRDKHCSQSSAFNPRFNSRIAGEGCREPFIDRHWYSTARASKRSSYKSA